MQTGKLPAPQAVAARGLALRWAGMVLFVLRRARGLSNRNRSAKDIAEDANDQPGSTRQAHSITRSGSERPLPAPLVGKAGWLTPKLLVGQLFFQYVQVSLGVGDAVRVAVLLGQAEALPHQPARLVRFAVLVGQHAKLK